MRNNIRRGQLNILVTASQVGSVIIQHLTKPRLDALTSDRIFAIKVCIYRTSLFPLLMSRLVTVDWTGGPPLKGSVYCLRSHLL